MSSIHRAPVEGFGPSVTWIADKFDTDRRVATLLLWEVAFKIGTDRHYWIDERRARAFVNSHQELLVSA
jgi:hypothetical protein